MNQELQYYSLGLDILCVTYFLTSITMPDRQNGDMRQKRTTVNDVNASCGISSPQQAVNSMSKRSFRWRFMYKFLLFPYSLSFLV